MHPVTPYLACARGACGNMRQRATIRRVATIDALPPTRFYPAGRTPSSTTSSASSVRVTAAPSSCVPSRSRPRSTSPSAAFGSKGRRRKKKVMRYETRIAGTLWRLARTSIRGAHRVHYSTCLHTRLRSQSFSPAAPARAHAFAHRCSDVEARPRCVHSVRPRRRKVAAVTRDARARRRARLSHAAVGAGRKSDQE